MKRKLGLLLAAPTYLFVGWLFTRLSEQYGRALDDLEFDFE